MKLDLVHNTKRNILSGYIHSLVGLVVPFGNRTLFLWLLGSGYLGLNGLFTSLIGILSLTELGFGAAIGYSMYKPIAEDDHALICAYLNFFRKIYRGIGLAIFFMGLLLLPFLSKLVHADLPPELNLRTLYLLHLTNTTVGYFFFAYRGSVLSSHQRYDLLTNIRIITTVAQFIATAIILFCTKNYYLYVLSTIFFTLTSNLLRLYLARKHYPELQPKGELTRERRRRILADVKDLFLHKVGGVISYSLDNVVISAFLGLTAVAIYGNYYYVCRSVTSLTGVLTGSMRAGIGNRLHLADNQENFRLFLRMHRLITIVTLWCAAVMLALFQPFISVWTGNQPGLIRHFLTPVLMVLYFYIWQDRQLVLVFRDADGLWHKDRWKPLVAGLANLTMNLLFIRFLPEAYKLDGVILSTILAFLLIEMPWETHALFSARFDGSQARIYWRSRATFALVTFLACLLVWGCTCAIPLTGYIGLVVKALAATAIATIFAVLLFRKDLLELWQTVCSQKHS